MHHVIYQARVLVQETQTLVFIDRVHARVRDFSRHMPRI